MQPISHFYGAACLLFLALLGPACRTSVPSTMNDPNAQPAGRGAAASGATASDSAGSAGDSTATTQIDVQSPITPGLACGPSECRAPANVAGNLLRGVTGLQHSVPDPVACCLDSETGSCGSAAATSAAMCEAPAIADESCPGIDLSALANLIGGLGKGGGNLMVGCCTEGACGCDGALFGRGCVENAEVKRMLGDVPVVGPLIVFPPSRACAGAAPSPSDGADSGV
jgi:hypothetical protein